MSIITTEIKSIPGFYVITSIPLQFDTLYDMYSIRMPPKGIAGGIVQGFAPSLERAVHIAVEFIPKVYAVLRQGVLEDKNNIVTLEYLSQVLVQRP